MSHITELEADTADLAIKDLNILKKAAERCGLEFRENQTTFHSWTSDRGSQSPNICKHALGLPAVAGKAKENFDRYEIGVVDSKKFPGTFSLEYDPYGGALDKHVGENCEDLMMFYQMEAARAAAEEQGYTYIEEKLEDGTYTATVEIN